MHNKHACGYTGLVLMKLEEAEEGEEDWVGTVRDDFLEEVRLSYAGKDETVE